MPADLRPRDVVRPRVDESALTGESVTVEKSHGHLPAEAEALGDQVNMAFKGMLVPPRARGRAGGEYRRADRARPRRDAARRHRGRATPLQRLDKAIDLA